MKGHSKVVNWIELHLHFGKFLRSEDGRQALRHLDCVIPSEEDRPGAADIRKDCLVGLSRAVGI